MKKLDNHTLTAVNAALQAGCDIMDIYLGGDQAFAVETKEDHSPLTAADTAGHRRIISCLEGTGIPVLSEEGAAISYPERQRWEELWIVDPLDGTKEFIRRNGQFTVNIALVRDGLPVLGVVYAPAARTLYYAEARAGSFRADIAAGTAGFSSMEELRAISRPLPEGPGPGVYTIVASRSHRNMKTDEFIAAKEKIHGRVEVISSGSSLKLCLVAEGTADIYPRLGPTMEWDTAAGHAVARFSGARVYDPSTGSQLRYNKPDLLNPFFIVERGGPGEAQEG